MKLNKALTGIGIEYFVVNDELFAFINGTRMHWRDVPGFEKEARRLELDQDPHAMAALKQWGLNEDEALKQFIVCTRGAFNQTPDVVNSVAVDQEYFDCGQHGSCPFEGKICKTIRLGEETLSFHEIAIIRLVVAGLSDKQIADQLNISYHTVTTHMQNIRRKTGRGTRVEVAVWALERGLC
jgi:DNA-binding CsgD family transcriptional regulator